MLSTGLRRGEALGLQWRDFDENAGVLSIRRALIREDGQLITKDTESSKRRSDFVSGEIG
jgi:integrase